MLEYKDLLYCSQPHGALTLENMPANIKNYGEIQRVVDENRKWYGYYARLNTMDKRMRSFFLRSQRK